MWGIAGSLRVLVVVLLGEAAGAVPDDPLAALLRERLLTVDIDNAAMLPTCHSETVDLVIAYTHWSLEDSHLGLRPLEEVGSAARPPPPLAEVLPTGVGQLEENLELPSGSLNRLTTRMLGSHARSVRRTPCGEVLMSGLGVEVDLAARKTGSILGPALRLGRGEYLWYSIELDDAYNESPVPHGWGPWWGSTVSWHYVRGRDGGMDFIHILTNQVRTSEQRRATRHPIDASRFLPMFFGSDFYLPDAVEATWNEVVPPTPPSPPRPR